MLAAITLGYMLTTGSWGRPATAEIDAPAVVANINNQLKPQDPGWEQVIAPQLQRRDQQVAEQQEQQKAAQAAADQAAQQAQTQVAASSEVRSSQPTGSCWDWMRQANISDSSTAYMLIMRESGCNPNAVNASSGACGIGQQLPCGKWGHQWNDPIGAMIDTQNYVYTVYGSWGNAWHHETAYGWY